MLQGRTAAKATLHLLVVALFARLLIGKELRFARPWSSADEDRLFVVRFLSVYFDRLALCHRFCLSSSSSYDKDLPFRLHLLLLEGLHPW